MKFKKRKKKRCQAPKILQAGSRLMELQVHTCAPFGDGRGGKGRVTLRAEPRAQPQATDDSSQALKPS